MTDETPRIAIRFIGGEPYTYRDWAVIVDGRQASTHSNKILAKLKARRLRKTLPPEGNTEVIVP